MPHRSLRQHQDCKSKSLSRVAIESLIIQPIQQIPRYPLLLQVRLKYYYKLLFQCNLSAYCFIKTEIAECDLVGAS